MMDHGTEWAKRGREARNCGDRQEALRCYVEAMAAANGTGNMAAMMHHGRHAADLHRELGNFDEAYVLINVTLGSYRENRPSDLELANTLRIAGLVDEAYEDRGRCISLWREACELYGKADVAAGVEECQRRLAQERLS